MKSAVELCREFAENHLDELNWKHTLRVVNIALRIAKEENADEEVVEIAAFLHDIGKVGNNDFIHHHIIGAEKAEDFLKKINYDKEKILKVKNAILRHMGPPGYVEAQLKKANKPLSICPGPITKEDKVLFDADMIDLMSKEGIEKMIAINKRELLSYKESTESIKNSVEAAHNCLKTKTGRRIGKSFKNNVKVDFSQQNL